MNKLTESQLLSCRRIYDLQGGFVFPEGSCHVLTEVFSWFELVLAEILSTVNSVVNIFFFLNKSLVFLRRLRLVREVTVVMPGFLVSVLLI